MSAYLPPRKPSEGQSLGLTILPSSVDTQQMLHKYLLDTQAMNPRVRKAQLYLPPFPPVILGA